MYEFKYRSKLYKEDPENPGHSIPFGRTKVIKRMMNVEGIVSISPHYTDDGKLDKDRCEIVHNDLGPFVIEMSYEEMKQLRYKDHIEIKGFKRDGKGKRRK